MTDEFEAPPKKKRKKSKSPTSRALDECKKRGWIAGVVEKFVRFPPPGHLVDLFGVIDIVAITPEGILGIQATGDNAGDMARRRRKILAEPRAKSWLEHARLEVWGWGKRGDRGKSKRWTLRVDPIAIKDFSSEASSEAAA